jgi:hypothetical protein
MTGRVRAVLCLAIALASAPLVVVACSGPGGNGPEPCPSVSMDCPSPPPSWAKDVQPVIQARCYTCHSEGGIEWPKWDLSSYASVVSNEMEVLTQVYQCKMPLPDASPPVPPLTSDQRQTIVQWIACSTPNN